ncbi:hypothetical protein BGZ65_011704, partial [Modicella reniformis]
MASTFQMVAPATAPIDIQSSHPPPCSMPPDLTSPRGEASAMGESFGDSGYESSWPSLSEASSWTPSSGQKRLKPVCGNSTNSANNVDIQHSPDYQHGPVKSQGLVQQKPRHTKDQRIKARTTQDFQHNKRTGQHHNTMMPLVDLGSPQMEDDDPCSSGLQVHAVTTQTIQMLSSVIPRGWLYEEESVPSPADDVLITLPKREWISDSSGPMAMDAKSFVVMSWNILSPRLCQASRLDVGCEPAFLDWNYRKEAILNQILYMDADVVCLQ